MQDVALFPPEARCVFYRTGSGRGAVDLTRYEDLHPDERNEVSAAVDVRKGEFGDARWCAHEALRQLGAQDFSTAVVGVGTSIEASVLITVNLVDLEIPHIWVKAISEAHGTILKRIGAQHIIFPEKDAGVRAAHLVNGRILEIGRAHV